MLLVATERHLTLIGLHDGISHTVLNLELIPPNVGSCSLERCCQSAIVPKIEIRWV